MVSLLSFGGGIPPFHSCIDECIRACPLSCKGIIQIMCFKTHAFLLTSWRGSRARAQLTSSVHCTAKRTGGSSHVAAGQKEETPRPEIDRRRRRRPGIAVPAVKSCSSTYGHER